MIAGRNPLALTYTALAFGIVAAPYFFFPVMMEEEHPFRLYLVSTLLASTLILALRLTGWSKLDNWLAQKQRTIARVSMHTITAIAFLYSCFVLISFAGIRFFRDDEAESLTWFYILVPLGLGSVAALLPIVLLKPSRFELAFRSRLTAKLKLFCLAAYGLLIALACFACVEVIKFYHYTHPEY